MPKIMRVRVQKKGRGRVRGRVTEGFNEEAEEGETV